MASPYVMHLNSLAEMDALLNEKTLNVFGFHATWSAPCRGIAPFYSRLAASHRTLTFVKVEIDADNIQSIAQNCRLIALPTFIMFKNQGEIDRIRGADRKGLEDMIAKHDPEAGRIARDTGFADVITAGDESLLEYLDIRQVNCLNEAQHHPLKSIVETKARNVTEAYLESDADEQLLITLPFIREVKVRSIVLYTKDPKFGPKRIKIDKNKNKNNLGFDEMESAVEPAVTQVLEVPEEIVKEGKAIQLQFVRLQRVNSLHIFVESNHGAEDVTRIDAIDVRGPSYGEPTATTQMTGLRDFWGTYLRGVELLGLFEREGDHQSLSDAAALIRESLLLCPLDHGQRAVLAGNLAVVLMSQYQHRGDHADLSEAITLFYETLELYPLGHQARASCLGNLSAALVRRYECEGNISDLEEAIERERQALNLRPRNHPSRAAPLNNLATALRIRYEHEGRASDLEESIQMQREALDLSVHGHPDLAGFLSNLSNALLARYRREGDLSDLAEAIKMLRQALDLPVNPSRPGLVSNLANALLTRYEREGGLSDLEEAIGMLREALGLHLPGDPSRAGSITNLANALRTRFERSGSVSDLEEAIEMQRQALNFHPPGRPGRAGFLNNLAIALRALYDREGGLSGLEEAIAIQREALEFDLPGHQGRASSLGNLSTALIRRYESEGDITDLKEAINMLREALDHHPPGHPDRVRSLSNLANALLTQYQREGVLSELEEAIEMQREALNLRPQGHPDRTSSLYNLAIALRTLYGRKGSLSCLEEAIAIQREALNAHLPGDPGHTKSINNLANALCDRYQRRGSVSDLQEAIEMQRQALKFHISGDPGRTDCLSNLASTLLTRYEGGGDLSDLEEAVEMQREALNLSPPGHQARASSLGNLAIALSTRFERERGLSDLEEVVKMQREALDLRPLGHQARALCLGNLSAALIRRYECEGNISDLEEAVEKQQNALDLLPLGDPDRTRSMNNLANALLARCKHEGVFSNLEEAIEKQREVLDLCPPGHPDYATSLSNLSNALLTRYEREEGLSDLEEATEQREKALELRPPGHPSRSECLFSLCRAYLLTINRKDGDSTMRDHRALVDKVFTMIREAVNHSNSPPLPRLKSALQWIDASPSLAPESVLDAYSAALDQLDIVLATSSTLEGKHTQLSSEDFVRCKQLSVEAATCAVRQGDMILAVELLERGRSLLFAQIGRYRVELGELQQENAELAKRFSDLSGLLDSSVVSNQTNLEGRTAFEDSIGRHRRVASDWDRAVNDIRAVPGFENFLRPLQYTALQAAAVAGPIVVVIPDTDQSHALIILHDRDTPYYVNLPKANEDLLVTLCNDFIQAVGSDDEYDANYRITSLLRSLWVIVVGPIAEALENKLRYPINSRIWWCPSSYLSFLPLHAAGRYTPNADPNQNFPAKYVSSYTSTLQALLQAQSKCSVRKQESMLIVAQPDTPGQGQLPNTVKEAEIVKTLAEGKMKMTTTLLSSKEGSHAAVLNGMTNHSWIHLTCHGNQNRANPFDSCFCLYDRELTLQDIMQRGLPDAKFAFLAACHTATGDVELLDEGLHLAAGLQFAGFKSVVGTLWEVADIDGPVIAEAFYKALQLGRVGEEGLDCSGAADALSKAVKHLRDNGVPISRWIRHIHIGV